MEKEYKKYFTAGTDGMHQLVYEDSSCRIKLPAADVRDMTIWVSIGKIISKNGNNITKLTVQQKLQVYKRVSAAIRLEGKEGIYTDEYKFIEVDMKDIDYSKKILDIEE